MPVRGLTEEQIEQILEKYTVGKVAFTLKGYQAIVPNMTEEETAFVLEQLKLAREQAIDYKITHFLRKRCLVIVKK